MNILHIDSSINGDGSASRIISAEIVRNLTTRDPARNVAYRDLAAAPLPHLTLTDFGTEEAEQVLREFEAADVVVIGTGMYNLTIPSQLKAWIDRIVISGRTFRYTEDGPQGLAGGKRVIVALARGGFYAAGTPASALEYAQSYLCGVFAFIGIDAVAMVNADGTAMPEMRKASISEAREHAARLAA